MTRGHGTGDSAEGRWEQLRAEERAAQLARVVQDSQRDARLAELLATKAAPTDNAAVNGSTRDH